MVFFIIRICNEWFIDEIWSISVDKYSFGLYLYWFRMKIDSNWKRNTYWIHLSVILVTGWCFELIIWTIVNFRWDWNLGGRGSFKHDLKTQYVQIPTWMVPNQCVKIGPSFSVFSIPLGASVVWIVAQFTKYKIENEKEIVSIWTYLYHFQIKSEKH